MPGLRREASSLAAKMMAALQPALTAVGKCRHLHLQHTAQLRASSCGILQQLPQMLDVFASILVNVRPCNKRFPQAAPGVGAFASGLYCCDMVCYGICMHGSATTVLVQIRSHSTMLSCTGTTPDNKAYQVHLEVLAALNAALAAVPAAFRSHQKALELFVCQLLARPDLSIDHRREAAHCYAALTKIKGDCKATPCNLVGYCMQYQSVQVCHAWPVIGAK